MSLAHADAVALMRRYYAEEGYTFAEADALAAASKLLQEPERGRIWLAGDGESLVGYFVLTATS
jgi:hypothetical protein